MQRNDDIGEIVAEYTPRLFRYIRSQVKSPEDAEDILQEVFYQLARASGDEGSEIERVSSWLYRVARNTILNFWRKRREISLDTEDTLCEDIANTLFCPSQDAPDTVYLRRLVWHELDAALAELSRTERGILYDCLRRHAGKRYFQGDRYTCGYFAFTKTLCREVSAQEIPRLV